jgi:hypothetical protein
MTTIYKQEISPILVITWKQSLTLDQKKYIKESISSRLNDAGWLTLIVDCMDKSEVKAFGVPESQLGEFEDLKELIESATKGKE